MALPEASLMVPPSEASCCARAWAAPANSISRAHRNAATLGMGMRKLGMRKSKVRNRAEDGVGYPFPSSLELGLRKYAVGRRLHFRWIFVFKAESEFCRRNDGL